MPAARRTTVASAALAAAALGALAALGACAAGDAAPEPADLAGSWDVTLVVGAADADPDAPAGMVPGLEPGEATFIEHWRFEGCDETGCTLRRPDGGVLLGDLDGVRVDLELTTDRFAGEAEAINPPPIEDASPCDTADTQRWTVDLDLDVDDDVLSGSIQRRAVARRADVDGETCFGIGLSLGLSGTPRADGGEEGQG